MALLLTQLSGLMAVSSALRPRSQFGAEGRKDWWPWGFTGGTGCTQFLDPYCFIAWSPSTLISEGLLGLQQRRHADQTHDRLKELARWCFQADGRIWRDPKSYFPCSEWQYCLYDANLETGVRIWTPKFRELPKGQITSSFIQLDLVRDLDFRSSGGDSATDV